MIGIGLCHAGTVQPEWLTCWDELEKPATPEGAPDWVALRVVRQMIHHARNHIITKLLTGYPTATHLFFLDDDVCLPPDGLMRLLAHNLPVVTGLYIQRGAPMLPVVYTLAPDGTTHVNLTRFAPGLQEIDACGAGCLLVRTDVLRAIAAHGMGPWFDWPASGLSEDLSFCSKVRALGYPLALDYDVQCTHLGILGVTVDLFLGMQGEGRVTYGDADLAHLSQTVRPWSYAREGLESDREHVIQGQDAADARERTAHAARREGVAARGVPRRRRAH